MIGKLVPCCWIEDMAEGIQVANARLVETMGIPVVSWLAEVVIGGFIVRAETSPAHHEKQFKLTTFKVKTPNTHAFFVYELV